MRKSPGGSILLFNLYIWGLHFPCDLRKIAILFALYAGKLRKTIFERSNLLTKVLFLFIGAISLFWFLIRVIPKPSRVYYPCMRAGMPFASAFIAYLITLTGSVLFFRKSIKSIRRKQIKWGIGAFAFAAILGTVTLLQNNFYTQAESVPESQFTDPLGPNAPIGEARGIFPGRVVWVYNPNATNEDCTNRNHSDAYWLEKNTDQDLVDRMFSDGLKSLTGKETHAQAWDAVFRHFNQNHEKGDTGYIDTETIFIKINAVTAWGGAWPDGEMDSDRDIEFDTSPQTILTLLRQLVNEAGVPQDKIYIGDPIADIYNHIYDYLCKEFPDVNYCTDYGVPGRYDLTGSSEKAVYFSDEGVVMDDINQQDQLFQEMMDADYLLNIPTMKGHRWAGVTLFAKNHFGSNRSRGSWKMHPGLINNDNNGMREEYNMYRVLVDLMGSKYLGQNTLLYFMDALWSTSYEHQPPQKFRTAPFNNDWSSSILLSLDHVAIESVCLDILQKEFTEEDKSVNPTRWTYVQFGAVDDYLHQAASSEWWPDGITYDPDKTGNPINSLGTHEHWKNADEMQYSRNLETGEGIELVKIFEAVNFTDPFEVADNLRIFPNPCSEIATISWVQEDNADITYQVIDMNARIVLTGNDVIDNGSYKEVKIDVRNLQSGVYLVSLFYITRANTTSFTERLVIN